MSAFWRAVLVASIALAGAALDGCGGDDPVSGRIREQLRPYLEAARATPSEDQLRGSLVRRLRLDSVQEIEDFYTHHDNRLMWSDENGRPLPRAGLLLDTIRRAAEHGLDPADYEVDRIDALRVEIDEHRSAQGDSQRIADFDMLLTSAFFRYASDLSTGSVHPDEVEDGWHTKPSELVVGDALERALEQDDLERLFQTLPPPHPGYERLRRSLAALREVAENGGWPAVPTGVKIGPGASGPAVATLRKRLGASLSDAVREATDASPERFTPALGMAIQRFQALHGLEPDGVASVRTIEELNVPVEERIRQIELNLERWRWIPRDLGNPHVLVNIPGFDLVLEGKDIPSWRTRVVAGKAYTPTPVFSDRIVALVANPPWNVPDSIAVNEYLPELRKDRHALRRHGIRLLQGSGDSAREIDSAGVDWDRVDADHFPYRLRQDPGPTNPLGRLKFDLTNDFHIYLHDTPGGHAFGRSERDLSHGCIRVQDAEELADRITGDDVRAKIREALDQPEERRVEMDSKVKVHILYWTAWVDDAGALHFGPDVYGFDPPQQAALDRTHRQATK